MKGLNMLYTAASNLRRPSEYALDAENGPNPPLPPKPNPNLLTVPKKTMTQEPTNEDAVTEDLQQPQDPQTPAPSVFEIDDEFNLPISVAITCWIIYIFMGASIYVVWEEWSFFESFYFVFISMSTIGFGDFVPNHPIYMMGSIVYLVFGMALTSMCINVVQVKLSDSFRQASAKIGATIGLRVSDEDGSLAPITPPPIEMPGVHGTPKPDAPVNV